MSFHKFKESLNSFSVTKFTPNLKTVIAGGGRINFLETQYGRSFLS